ncbi:MAG: hypothetical protein ACPGVZ_03865, partial [Myxococcota bacterium]
MRILNGLLAGFTTLLVASAATAALTVAITDTTPADLSSVAIGETITVNISISTTAPEATALGLRAANYNPAILTGATFTAPDSIFNFAPSVPFGGISNTPGLLGEQEPLAGVRAGTSVNLFQGVSLSPAAGAGPESFQVEFVAGEEGTTTLDVGVFADYSDAYLGGDNAVTNDSV